MSGPPKNLWCFTDADEQGLGGAGDMYSGSAPKIQPTGSTGEGAETTGVVINVVDDFPWTHSMSNRQALVDPRGDVPYIDLVEHTITQLSQVNQIANNFVAAAETLNPFDGNRVVEQITTDIGNGEATDLLDTLGAALNSASSSATTGEAGANTNSMFPYSNLYTTSKTGFRYRMPYFTTTAKSITNQFTENNPGGGGLLGGVLEGAEKLSEGAASATAKTANAFEPGSYIEQSKYFSFSGRENSYQFSFPLNNCDNPESIKTNWQLLYLLSYQNLPNRMSRDLIMPPAIYTAHIPGVWYSPYAYISNLNIDYLGTRRRMTLDIPVYTAQTVGSTIPVEVIIPDVYLVKITMAELVGEAQNMLYHLVGGANKVTT